jgi:hypothetical protein
MIERRSMISNDYYVMMKYKPCILCTHIYAPISLGIKLLTNMELSILCGIEDMSSNLSITNTISPFELILYPTPKCWKNCLVGASLPIPFPFCTSPWLYKMGIQGLLPKLVPNYPCPFDKKRQTPTTTNY